MIKLQSAFVTVCVCATVVVSTSILARGGPLNPPAGGIQSTGATLAQINESITVGSSRSELVQTGQRPAIAAMFLFQPDGTPIPGGFNIGPFVDAIKVTGHTGPSRRRGDTTLGDVVVVKEVDASTPKLMEAVCNGTAFARGEIHFLRTDTGATPQTYYKVTFKDLIITSYQTGGSAGAAGSDPLPTEELAINFAEIKVTYTEDTRAGSTTWSADGTCLFDPEGSSPS